MTCRQRRPTRSITNVSDHWLPNKDHARETTNQAANPTNLAQHADNAPRDELEVRVLRMATSRSARAGPGPRRRDLGLPGLAGDGRAATARDTDAGGARAGEHGA